MNAPVRVARSVGHLALAVVCLVAALALSACTSPVAPSGPPSITGAASSLVPGDGRPASFWVESTGTPPAGAISDRALVIIAPSTVFLAADGSRASLAAIAAIRNDTRVSVWFQGVVVESNPVQGTAATVKILGK